MVELHVLKNIFSIHRFVDKLERHGICLQQSGATCHAQSFDIICEDGISSPETLHINFNLTIFFGYVRCTGLNCQEKYDRIVEVLLF